MADIIPLYETEESFEPLFCALWAKIGMAAIEAQDAGVEARADVLTAGTLALGRALAIMADGDRAAVDILLATAIETLKAAVDEGVDMLGRC